MKDRDMACLGNMPPELLFKIIKNVCKIEGTLLMSLDRSCNGYATQGEFHVSVKLLDFRHMPGESHRSMEKILIAKDLRQMVSLALVCRKWDPIVREVFRANKFIFFKETKAVREMHTRRHEAQRTEWLASSGAKLDRYDFSGANISLQLPIFWPYRPYPAAVMADIFYQQDLVYLQLSRDLGRLVTAPVEAIKTLEEVDKYLLKEPGPRGQLVMPVTTLRIDVPYGMLLDDAAKNNMCNEIQGKAKW
jgi:hypothetical protein